MTYFPPRDETPPKAERCPGCGDWYFPQRGPAYVSCGVNHPPGSCCHYGETKAEPPVAA